MHANQILVRRVFDVQLAFPGVLQSFADAPRKVSAGRGNDYLSFFFLHFDDSFQRMLGFGSFFLVGYQSRNVSGVFHEKRSRQGDVTRGEVVLNPAASRAHVLVRAGAFGAPLPTTVVKNGLASWAESRATGLVPLLVGVMNDLLYLAILVASRPAANPIVRSHGDSL